MEVEEVIVKTQGLYSPLLGLSSLYCLGSYSALEERV